MSPRCYVWGYNGIVKFLEVLDGCLFRPKVSFFPAAVGTTFSIVPCALITIRHPGLIISKILDSCACNIYYLLLWWKLHLALKKWHPLVHLHEICDWQLWCNVEQDQPELKRGFKLGSFSTQMWFCLDACRGRNCWRCIEHLEWPFSHLANICSSVNL